MPFTIVRDDITHVRADAIVNAANAQLRRGGGVCGAIFAAAGAQKLQAACDKIGYCPTGSAVATPAFHLPARYIIHAVGPVWQDGNHGERTRLASCYRTSLELAASLKCTSIAFPLISAGIYGYPRREALEVAQEEFRSFLLDHDMDIILVLFDTTTMDYADELRLRVASYIDDVYVDASGYDRRRDWETNVAASAMIGAEEAEGASWSSSSPVEAAAPSTGTHRYCSVCRHELADTSTYCMMCGHPTSDAVLEPFASDDLGATGFDAAHAEGATLADMSFDATAAPAPSSPAPAAAPYAHAPAPGSTHRPRSKKAKAGARPHFSLPNPLRNLLTHLDAGFSETLLAMIDERGLKDSQVYKRANISRQHFSKMRSNPSYKPTKTTVLALAVALELSHDETCMLLERAGFALSHADKRDVIVEFFINEGNYDIFQINDTLFAFDQPLLG
ncbi:MAG: macro domain-containing protein [Atopobiaceae bacterium]|nr:macro domain-containing protein [Atopobiaceae bacterium]